jgi:hypothetical protein
MKPNHTLRNIQLVNHKIKEVFENLYFIRPTLTKCIRVGRINENYILNF